MEKKREMRCGVASAGGNGRGARGPLCILFLKAIFTTCWLSKHVYPWFKVPVLADPCGSAWRVREGLWEQLTRQLSGDTAGHSEVLGWRQGWATDWGKSSSPRPSFSVTAVLHWVFLVENRLFPPFRVIRSWLTASLWINSFCYQSYLYWWIIASLLRLLSSP